MKDAIAQQQIAIMKNKILEEQLKNSDKREGQMRVVLITVVSAILIGIVIYGMLRFIAHFHPQKVIRTKGEYDEANRNENTLKKTISLGELELQYDPNKDYVAMFDTGAKLK
jgi:hypothetical protein